MRSPSGHCCLTQALNYDLIDYLMRAAVAAVQPIRFWNWICLNLKMTMSWPRF